MSQPPPQYEAVYGQDTGKDLPPGEPLAGHPHEPLGQPAPGYYPMQQQQIPGQYVQQAYWQHPQPGMASGTVIVVQPNQSVQPDRSGLKVGWLKKIGIVLCVLGGILFVFGLIAMFALGGRFGYGIWGGGLFIATGAVAILSGKNPQTGNLTALMVLAIISAVLSGIVMLINMIYSAMFSPLFLVDMFLNVGVFICAIFLASVPCRCCFIVNPHAPPPAHS